MDIPALSMAMAQSRVLSDVNIAVLDKSLEVAQDMGSELTKLMEQSVTSYLGGNIDISL